MGTFIYINPYLDRGGSEKPVKSFWPARWKVKLPKGNENSETKQQTIICIMKTPEKHKGMKTRKTISELGLKQSTGKPLKFRFNEKGENSACFKQRVVNRKSETTINKNLIAVHAPLLNASKSQLMPTPKTPKQPKETLRRNLLKLKGSQWNDSVLALHDIVQISRFDPQLLVKSLPAIYKGITAILKSLRINAARTACQAANELFMNVPPEEGPDFDELIHTLLQKAADPNKHLRKDALEALDSMVIHGPPAQSIRILLHRRIAGYSLGVRITASKLLACVLGDSDAHSAASLSEEIKARLVFGGMRFLQDCCQEIRFHGMRLMTMMMQNKEFENVFQTKVTPQMLGQINKSIENVRKTIRTKS